MRKLTGSRAFLDSSIWLGYFLGNMPKTRGIIDNSGTTLYTSIISIHEIYKRLRALGKTAKETKKAIKFVEDNSIIVNLDKKIATSSAENSMKHGLHTIDSLIYSSAMAAGITFITADTDFEKTPKTTITSQEGASV